MLNGIYGAGRAPASDVPAAGDFDGDSRDVARQVGGEEQRGVGDVPRLADPAERYLGDALAQRVLRHLVDHGGTDDPGLDRVHPDAVAGALLRGRLGKPDQSRLGGTVVGLAWVADLAGYRGDVDDGPARRLLAHLQACHLRAQPPAEQVYLDDLAEVRSGHLPQHAVARDARVVDHDVHAAPAVHAVRDQ